MPPAVGVPCLIDVARRALLADVLAELLAAEEVDEARAGDDRDDARDDAGDEDSGHAVTPASASATRSSPRTRAPLTSTQSPGLELRAQERDRLVGVRDVSARRRRARARRPR